MLCYSSLEVATRSCCEHFLLIIYQLMDEEDEDEGEKGIRSLAVQLNGHMDSLKGNLDQAGGVLESMAKGKAMLQDILLSRLSPADYEMVLFG